METTRHLERSRTYHAPGWRPLDRLLGQTPFVPVAPVWARRIIERGLAPIQSAPLGSLGVPHCVDLGIEGYLLRQDALKIYELAFISPGDVLELGTHYGLSTSIIARALEDRDLGHLETCDIDSETNAKARVNIEALPFAHRATLTLKDATARMDELITEGKKFGFIFVDHWHGYEVTYDAALRVPQLLAPGGWVLFHDFLDPGNAEPDHPYGVYQAVLDTICLDDRFTFRGYSGSTATFQFLG